VLPADVQQNQSNKIRNYFIFVSGSSALISPTLDEKSLLAVNRSRNMIEKRTQKKIHNRSDRTQCSAFAAFAQPHRARARDARRSMQILDALK
jgi:hypothetical protein